MTLRVFVLAYAHMILGTFRAECCLFMFSIELDFSIKSFSSASAAGGAEAANVAPPARAASVEASLSSGRI
jgi:hypothetical protein